MKLKNEGNTILERISVTKTLSLFLRWTIPDISFGVFSFFFHVEAFPPFLFIGPLPRCWPAKSFLKEYFLSSSSFQFRDKQEKSLFVILFLHPEVQHEVMGTSHTSLFLSFVFVYLSSFPLFLFFLWHNLGDGEMKWWLPFSFLFFFGNSKGMVGTKATFGWSPYYRFQTCFGRAERYFPNTAWPSFFVILCSRALSTRYLGSSFWLWLMS